MATEKQKKAKNYEFLGLGFAVILSDVNLRFAAGEWLPQLNMGKLQDAAFLALLRGPTRLTGAQLAFIRGYMNLTQEEFAKGLGLTTHAQVSRWEKKGHTAAGLSPAHEANLRVLMNGHLGIDTISVRDHIRVLSGGLKEPCGPLRLTG